MINMKSAGRYFLKLLLKPAVTVVLLTVSMDLYAGYDYFSAGIICLSVHPGNQRDLAEYYPRKLDSNADFILTPGISLGYDRSLNYGYVSHMRFTAGYFDDCASMPAGYIAAGAMLDIMHRKYFSIQMCLGLAGYMRENWEHKLGGHYSTILKESGPVEWIVIPFPEIELQFYPAHGSVQLVVDIMSVIYVSIINVGIRVPF